MLWAVEGKAAALVKKEEMLSLLMQRFALRSKNFA
jgi:hypothetical protein